MMCCAEVKGPLSNLQMKMAKNISNYNVDGLVKAALKNFFSIKYEVRRLRKRSSISYVRKIF